MAVRQEAVVIPALEQPLPRAPMRWLSGALWFIRRKPLGAFGAVTLVALVIIALLAPWLTRYPYTEVHFSDSLVSPNGTYWFGTDIQGRDYFSRMVIASEVTLLAGLGTVFVAAFLSLIVGGVSGYLGGRVDMIVQRVVDIWVALPPYFLLITFVAVLGSGGGGFLGLGKGPDVGLDPRHGDWIWYTFFRSTVVIFTLGIVFAGYGSRVIRSSVLAIKENPYIDAARSMGAGDIRIMFRYVLPNIMPVVIVLASLNLGAAVLAESTISFLGFGIRQPFPTWGYLLASDGRLHGPGHEYLMFIPGIAIFVSVYGFNMLGDALRDVLDPRLRGGR